MESTNEKRRKPYKAPRLTVYGNIREVTTANRNMMVADGAGTANVNKTG